MVSGDFYMSVDSNGIPISYQTRNVTKLFYNGSRVNANFDYSGLLPFGSYKVQVNASNRAGYILSNHVIFPTSAAGELILNLKANIYLVCSERT